MRQCRHHLGVLHRARQQHADRNHEDQQQKNSERRNEQQRHRAFFRFGDLELAFQFD